jgi:hypothetical protein
MSESEMQAELERLRAENAQLKRKDKGGLTLKVSEKGGVSLCTAWAGFRSRSTKNNGSASWRVRRRSRRSSAKTTPN